jgi:uncharacterized membrane protein YbhN (UPF0104 family)
MSFVFKVFVSLGVSIALLGSLIHFSLSSAEPAIWPRIVEILSSYPLVFLSAYLGAALLRTFLQALRYRLLLKPATQEVPSLFHLLLVTLSRNMFVDMLPARLGELSYIAMLNRGYRVSGQACISSLVISFVFDLIALTCLVLVLVFVQIVGGEIQTWMFLVLLVLAGVIGLLVVLLYPILAMFNRNICRVGWLQHGIFARLVMFSNKVQTALDETRAAGIVVPVMLLSLGIRITKYLGLYCLFVGVVIVHFPEMTTRIVNVTAALISAEAGASLPIPAFMSFGTYEAAGTMALIVLGANSATSLTVMLAMHIVSQIVDYLLGAIGLIAFIFVTPVRGALVDPTKSKAKWLWWVFSLVILGVAAMFLIYEMRAISKRGALRPPDRGAEVQPLSVTGEEALSRMQGFVVWSSNRSGNHDIYLLHLADKRIERLTDHPHSEYYPRVSPDGKQIVFARGHQEWVPQRNIYAWDIILLNLETGEERLLAKHGNVPTWSADGRRIFFQRNGTEVVELELSSNHQRIVYKSGETVNVPSETILETPTISGIGDMLAVTLRGAVRATAVVDHDGEVRRIGNGCQLNWGPEDRYLYTIDHGGKMQNVLYRIDPQTLMAEKWFDSPGEYSHEYFPRVANTGDVLVYGASNGGHEHDTADYEIFLWIIGQPAGDAIRLTYHTGNDCWPDVFLEQPLQ